MTGKLTKQRGSAQDMETGMISNPDSAPLILVIVNRLFEWSQNFITRELVELNEQGAPILIATRQIQARIDLTEPEQKLLEKTILIPEYPFTPKALFWHLKIAFQHSSRYRQAWKSLFSLRHTNWSKFFRGVVCLCRAACMVETLKSYQIRHIHAHFLTAPGETALYLSKMAGISYGATAHAMDIYKDNSGLAGKIRHAVYLATCTQANEQHLKSLSLPDPSKIHKVYHGIPLDFQEIPNTTRRPFTFIAVGRMVEKKGFHFLIEACALLKEKHPDFKVFFLGDGPLRARLQEQAKTLDVLERLHFEGFIPPNKMADFYRQADVLVMPSIIDSSGDRDGIPNVCLEAMNYGLPVIGSNVSGLPEVVLHQKTGWLVAAENAQELANAMGEAMIEPALAAFRKAAQEWVRQNFSLKENVRVLRNLMESSV